MCHWGCIQFDSIPCILQSLLSNTLWLIQKSKEAKWLKLSTWSIKIFGNQQRVVRLEKQSKITLIAIWKIKTCKLIVKRRIKLSKDRKVKIIGLIDSMEAKGTRY